ncbi:MAG: hypothetical protein ACTSXX_02925 [Candidatus Baldrarchaeia archaeon]
MLIVSRLIRVAAIGVDILATLILISTIYSAVTMFLFVGSPDQIISTNAANVTITAIASEEENVLKVNVLMDINLTIRNYGLYEFRDVLVYCFFVNKTSDKVLNSTQLDFTRLDTGGNIISLGEHEYRMSGTIIVKVPIPEGASLEDIKRELQEDCAIRLLLSSKYSIFGFNITLEFPIGGASS